MLAVTNDNKLSQQLKRISNAIAGLDVTVFTPDKYNPAMAQAYDMAVFHHFVPQDISKLNAIYIMPDKDNPSFKIKSIQQDDLRIMDWNREHPTLKYLNFLDELNLKKVQSLEIPLWANSLIESSNFPLAWEGIYKGRRIICLGFELGDYLFTADQDVSAPILLLNMLDWLTPRLSGDKQLATGDKYILKHDAAIEKAYIETPTGEQIKLKPKNGIIDFSDTNHVGLYKLHAQDVTGKQITRTFAANLLNEKESQITPLDIEEALPESETKIEFGKEKLEIWTYIILAALCLLFTEWWVYFKKLA